MLRAGDVLQSRYAIERLIGQGGMGRVYLGRQIMLRRLPVAIKEVAFDHIHADDLESAREAFRREAETLASLSHPNLVDVKDCFEESGHLYLVMEYVDAEPMDAPDGPLPLRTIVDVARQLCSVLSYLHSQSPPVLFRDLKPGNILMEPDGRIRLVDFGLAQEREMTPSLILQGTPGYAPLEQLTETSLPCDERTDIYGLGATLWFLMTGHQPVDSRTRMVDDVLDAPVGMPTWLTAAVVRMLALRPEDRFSSVHDIANLLERHAPTDRALPRVEAFVRDGQGRAFDLEIFEAGEAWIRFCCPERRWIRRPKEVFFKRRGHREAVAVPIRAFDSDEVQGESVYQVVLDTPPPSLMRLLRASLPLARGRNARRFEVNLPVDIAEVEVSGEAIDLSETGSRLVTTAPLPLGRRLHASIRLPGGMLPAVVAEVRWCQARPDGYESGLVFTDVDGWTIQGLRQYFARCA
ncbi:MAG TPA: serine/threonine-protein kinase [Candidatus Xenobia bacterium]|jgi:hypothetical protein